MSTLSVFSSKTQTKKKTNKSQNVGKSTIGKAVADAIGAQFIDGDDLHPQKNIEKMSAGIPLQDCDRFPWLIKVGEMLSAASAPTVVGCSALKRKYRDKIREEAGADTVFAYLDGSKDLIYGRMSQRPGHFMPKTLLDSQFSDLEIPSENEISITVSINQSVGCIVSDIIDGLTELTEVR